jgi:putative transposase
LDALFRVDKTFKAFFAGIARFPKFKPYGRYNSFSYPQSGFKLKGNKPYLSKIENLKLVAHREVKGFIKRLTVIRDIDQWFVALTFINQEKRPRSSKGAIGVDTGLLNVTTLSDGVLIENPRTLKQSAEKIRTLQCNLSGKKKGSRKREKARTALTKAWRKVRRQRGHFAHNISSKLATENSIIVFEDLISNMVKNHNLASAIMDATWGRLRRLTAHKAEMRGGRVLLVNPSGTSQKCSGCEWTSPTKLTLKDRTFHCANCRFIIDRDVHAARNILKSGLRRSPVEIEPLLVRRIRKFQSRKQETNGLGRWSSRSIHQGFDPIFASSSLIIDELPT